MKCLGIGEKNINNMFFKNKEKSYKENLDYVSIEENFENLVFFTKLISHLEYFVFFGSLLGLVRENNLIEGDDDIDLYVNIKHRDELIKILKDNSVEVNLNLSVNKNDSFLQIKRSINNKDLICDFYFYEDHLDEKFIVEKWNFEGGTNDTSKHLRIPKIYIFPIQTKTVRSFQINFPAEPIYLCEFLYGKNWRSKLKKDYEYTIKVIDGKPILFKVKKTLFGVKYLIE